MNRVARKGLVTAMVAGGVLASAGYAQADSAAGGTAAGSPGVLSGNSVQVPVDAPVNVCGNTIDVVGVLNPAFGNSCANAPGSGGSSSTGPCAGAPGSAGSSAGVPAAASAPGGAHGSGVISGGPRRSAGGPRHAAPRHARGGATARSAADGSPGVASGDSLAVPVDVPVNISGNSVDPVGILNPAFGNTSVNAGTPRPAAPSAPAPAPGPAPTHRPIPAPPADRAAATAPTLAHTGAGGVGTAAAGGAAALLAGAVLYRRFRPGRDG